MTERTIIDVKNQSLLLEEAPKGYTIENIQAVTETELIVSSDVKLETY